LYKLGQYPVSEFFIFIDHEFLSLKYIISSTAGKRLESEVKFKSWNGYSKFREKVFFGCSELTGIDVKSFRVFPHESPPDEYFALDNKSIFKNGRPISNDQVQDFLDELRASKNIRDELYLKNLETFLAKKKYHRHIWSFVTTLFNEAKHSR
jgi:hypothetical protein